MLTDDHTTDGLPHSSAHEITHAFDDSGINYDRDGSSAQLYDNQTIRAFHREASCLRDQYYRYSVAGEYCAGEITSLPLRHAGGR